jgi:hypothetical protein
LIVARENIYFPILVTHSPVASRAVHRPLNCRWKKKKALGISNQTTKEPIIFASCGAIKMELFKIGTGRAAAVPSK